MKVVDLIKQIPTDTQQRVKAATKRYGPSVREAIRAEIRLQLTLRAAGRRLPHFRSEVPTVIDRVGYPQSLKAKIIPEDQRISALLSLWKPWLVMLRNSSSTLEGAFAEQGPLHSVVHHLPAIHPLVPSLGEARQLSEILLSQIKQYDLVKDILEINEDILGHYIYTWNGAYPKRSSGHVDDEAHFDTSSQIVLYWGVIGLVAMALGVDVADLTVVVLAHEVAHAYTHLGFDIDQYRWGSANFSESDHEVKEGLAQYYTDRVVKAMVSTVSENDGKIGENRQELRGRDRGAPSHSLAGT